MKLLSIGALVAAVALVAVVVLGRPGPARSASTHAGGITVSGTGTASVAPDQANFEFVVETTGGTAREALAANASQTRDVLYALEKHGVRAKDIQTQDV